MRPFTKTLPNNPPTQHHFSMHDFLPALLQELVGDIYIYIYMSGGPINLPKFLPISFFRRVSRFIGVSGHLAFQ